jgi:hypothetical protein
MKYRIIIHWVEKSEKWVSKSFPESEYQRISDTLTKADVSNTLYFRLVDERMLYLPRNIIQQCIFFIEQVE